MMRFWGSRSGAMAVVGALLASAMMMAMGGAVDLTRAMNARQALQKRLDSALISAARADATTLEERRAVARDILGLSYTDDTPPSLR